MPSFRRAARLVLFHLFLLLPWLFLSPSSQIVAAGAKPYALIFGTVWDPDNRPAYGIKIKIRRENETKTRWNLTSDRRGEFAQRVPAGKQDYVVWADLKGVRTADGKPVRADEVRVHIDNDERADIGIHLTE